MTIDFYYLPGSAPCRAVLMTAKALGLEMNLKLTNLMAGEHMTPEFLKLNPQHTIPTLVDNGFSLWESRPIMIYLVEKYAKTDSLYPKNPEKRAIINQRLTFDMLTLYHYFAIYYYPILKGLPQTDENALKNVETTLGYLDLFLTDHKYVTSDYLTLADISLFATMSTIEAVGHDFSNFKNIERWFILCKQSMPGQKLNQEGIEEFKKYFEKKD